MNTIKNWAIVAGLLVFIVGAPIVAIGAYWHWRDVTPHKTVWNDRYSEMTTPTAP